MSFSASLLQPCSSSPSLNLFPDPPRPLLHLEDLTTMLLVREPGITSVMTSPSGTRLSLNPGSSVLIGKSGSLQFK